MPRLPLPLIEPALVEKPPRGLRWAHEIKWDGWRVQACLTAGKAALYTRRGNGCTKRFPSIATAMAKLKTADVVLDGEAVAIDDQGRLDFHAVLGAGARVVYKPSTSCGSTAPICARSSGASASGCCATF